MPSQLNLAIDRVQSALEAARGLPEYTLPIAMVLLFLTFILCLHVAVLCLFSPCIVITIRAKKKARLEAMQESSRGTECGVMPDEQQDIDVVYTDPDPDVYLPTRLAR